jgi:hypothetical protein
MGPISLSRGPTNGLALRKVGSLSRGLNITLKKLKESWMEKKSAKRNGQTTWNEWIEAAYRGSFSSTNLGDGGIWEDGEEDGKTRNTLSFKGTGLKT